LKAACAEASPGSQITDFEAGVFCGKYSTPVPDGYFEHLNAGRGEGRKIAGDVSGTLVGNSGPVSVISTVIDREDISLHNLAANGGNQ